MWVLPSRNRPQNLERLAEACRKTEVTTPILLRLDEINLQHPKYNGWIVETGPCKPLSAIYNEIFAKYPDLPWYGFIADDVVPVTPNWDTLLIKAAGIDGMAVPAGGETTGGTPHFVLGGDLVRSICWLALPGLDRIYIDTVLADIARNRGVLRFLPDVLLEHWHFSNNMALFDNTYKKHNKDKDREIYEKWKNERGF